MENIKHIFFDLDHTLWDFDKNSLLAFKKIFQEQQIQINFDDFMKVYVPKNLEFWKLYREEKITKEKLRYYRLKNVFEVFDYKASDQFINKVSEDYIKYLSLHNHLMKGTIELLNYLHPKYRLHIITNGFDIVQKNKLKASKINKYFDVIVTSDSVGVKKPNPKVFEFAMDKAEANPSESVMIGDNFEVDVLGASNIGMNTIYFKNFQEQNPQDFIAVDTLLEMKQYF